MQLRQYQLDLSLQACQLLHQYNIAYLSMEVRTGKTLTALHTADVYGAKKVLFVSKLKALSSIVCDYNSLGPSYEMMVINFEQVHKIERVYDLVIVDEAHSLGQFPIPSERAKHLKIVCEGKPVIFLSGTPSPESISQLYHQFYISSFSPFNEYKTFYKWANEFVNKKVKYIYNRQINDYSEAIKEKVDKYCNNLFISYTQEDAGFIEDVKEEVLLVKMQPGTYALAEKLKKRRVHIGKDGQEIVADTEVSLMQKLHQIYSGSVITANGTAILFDQTKAKFIKEYFEGKKVAIFYKFRAELSMLEQAFGKGNLTADPQVFNTSNNKVFASQIQSGREGTNLSTADCLIFLNIDFAAVSYWQARARLQTRDRIKPVLLYWIFSDGGIEEKIYRSVMNKKDYTLQYFKKDFKVSAYA